MAGRPRLFKETTALDSAMKIFWAKGYEATSISMLSDAMRLNTPSIYGAFGDKESLFLKVIDRYVEVYGKPAFLVLSESRTFREGIASFISLRIDQIVNKEHPGCMVATVVADAALLSPKFEKKLKVILKSFDDLIVKRVQRGIVEGDLPEKTEPKAVARILHSLLIGFAIRARARESERSLRTLANDSLNLMFGSPR